VRLGLGAVAASSASIGALAASCASFESSPDADPRGDGGAFEAASIEGGAGGCAAHAGAVFCADFDDGALDRNWTAFSVGSGRAALDTNARSRPGAVRMTLPAGERYNGPQLRKRLDGSFSRLRCTAHVARVDVGQSLVDMMNLEVTTSAEKMNLRAYMGAPTGAAVLHVYPPDGGSRYPYNVAGPSGFNPGEFHSITMEFELPIVRLYVDGAVIASADPAVRTPPTGATVTIGPAGVEGPSSDWTLLYDDVFCERE
jgi:hypothetical protein